MNVFVIGWSPSGSADEVRARNAFAEADVLREKLGGGAPQSWSSADGYVTIAFLRHGPEYVPAARYVHLEHDRMALYAGMPFAWTDDHLAEGRGTLDAASFLTRDLSGPVLDGRFVVARYVAGVLEVLTDRLGAYPMFAAEGGGMTWIGNAPFVVSRAAGRTAMDTEALGHFLTIGWSLGGAPLWKGVRRLPRATLEARHRTGRFTRVDLLPAAVVAGFFGGRPDMTNAARILKATVRAQSDWPGRPVVVPVSGGRDSRVVLAAAVAGGVEFTSRVIAFPRASGFPNTPDVLVSGEVMTALHRQRRVVAPSPEGGLRWSARLVRQSTHGLMSLLETGLVGLNAPGEPLEIIHSGGGGELSRGLLYAGDNPSEADVAARILGSWVHRVPQPITSQEMLAATGRYVTDWVALHSEAGFPASDLTDAFWLFERLQHWLAPPQHLQELSNDTTAPLWSPRMLPFAFAGRSRDRMREPLHYALLKELAPVLASVPFEGIDPDWPSFPSHRHRARSQRALALKVWREVSRRTEAWRLQRRGTLDPLLLEARGEVVDAMAALPSHPVWDVLDLQRTRKLLAREPYTLDPRSQAVVWRLATIVAADMPTA